MTFPTLVGTTGYVQNTAGTSWPVFSGVSVNRGSIILVSCGSASATLSTASTGWQKVSQVDDTDGPNQGSAALFRAIANNSAFTVSSSASRKFAAALVRISSGGTVSATAAGDSENPPTHTISSVEDVLWVEGFSSAGDSVASSPSTGYGGLITAQSDGSAGSTSISLAYRTNRASSENPSALSGINGTSAWTIALYYFRRKIRGGGTI